MATFWHLCESCGHGNHINVLEKGYGQIKILGAPGPNWAQVTFFPCDSIRFRKDPEFLHVWVGGKHFEVVARKLTLNKRRQADQISARSSLQFARCAGRYFLPLENNTHSVVYFLSLYSISY
jgi:hypothetical protein